jgi:lysophospholipase L1-like esterase
MHLGRVLERSNAGRRVKGTAVNVGLMIGGMLIALIGTELALRLIVGTRQHQRELKSMLVRSQQTMPESGVANVSLRGLVQPSANDRLVYELKPRLRANFIGVPVEINQAGFRERDVPVKKPKGTVRIVGLGDSHMFGWGVPVEGTYLRVLEGLLQHRRDPVRYETLNFAVPGYNAAMEVECFLSIARHYGPDLVIVGLVGNDADIPNFMKQSGLKWPSTIYLYNLVVHGAAVMRNRARQLMPQRWDSAEGRLVPVGEIPEQFRDMVGLEAVRRSYEKLAHVTRDMKIPVLVVGDYRTMIDPVQVTDLEASAQFVFMDDYDLRAYERQHNVTITPQDIRLSPTDPHPNVLGHAVIAEGIYRTLVDRGLIPLAETKRPRPRSTTGILGPSGFSGARPGFDATSYHDSRYR